jgi:hypothetical protein
MPIRLGNNLEKPPGNAEWKQPNYGSCRLFDAVAPGSTQYPERKKSKKKKKKKKSKNMDRWGGELRVEISICICLHLHWKAM